MSNKEIIEGFKMTELELLTDVWWNRWLRDVPEFIRGWLGWGFYCRCEMQSKGEK